MFVVPIGSSKGYGMYLFKTGQPPKSSWPDKLMFDLVRGVEKEKAEWIDDIHLFHFGFGLHRKSEAIFNVRNYPVRVYIGFSNDKFNEKVLLHTAKFVADKLNVYGNLREPQKVLVMPDSFLESKDASWCDYIGEKKTLELVGQVITKDLKELRRIFSRHPDEFHCFWKTGQITLDAAREIDLPLSMSTEIKDFDEDISETG